MSPLVLPRWLLIGALVAIAACGGGPTADQPEAAEAPAHVEGAVAEAALNTITLTAEAEERLGIETDAVRREVVQAMRSYGGIVEVPRGRSYTVPAPVAGTIVAPTNGSPPRPGERLAQHEEVFLLLPLAPPAQDLLRLEAESEARVEAARLRTTRAEQMLADQAGSVRQLEEARTELAVAEATLAATQAQLRLLNRTTGPEGLPALALVSPVAARLATLHVAVGQAVTQGTALFDVYEDDPLWIRVPVYAGEIGLIDDTRPASVHSLGAPMQALRGAATADPVPAPLSADAVAATVDLFYRIANPDGALRPGQRVGVTLELRDEGGTPEQQVVVARSAVVYDAQGGTWVYEATAPQVYVRRRVEITRVVGDLAVLARGPDPGTAVVTQGVAELFGTEFGVSH